MKEIFPEPEYKLKPLSDDHPVWRAKHLLTPGAYPLWGIEHGCRTVVIYSPKDLSCYWNQAERVPDNTAVILATRVGQNVDRLRHRHANCPPTSSSSARCTTSRPRPAKRGALRIAKLQHAGELEHRPAGRAQPDGRAPQAPLASTWSSTTRSSSHATPT